MSSQITMGKIRVLHVVSVDKENYYLNNLVDYSPPDEVKYLFATFAGECEFGRSLEERGQKMYYLNSLRRAQYPGALRRLLSIIKDEDPDVVHTHLFDTSVIGLTAAKWQKRKTVLTRHHSDAIHEIQSPIKRRFYLGLENYISRMSDHIIAPSRMVRDFLVDKEGVPERKVSIIPYGQTTERFDVVTDTDVSALKTELGMGDEIALVCVSRLFHRKGHEFLFDAFADLIGEGLEATLYLVGDGDHKPVLEQKAVDLGIRGNVRFLGWRSDALVIMKAADVIVHPSLEDALSSAVIESIMLEKPIVATDISGVRDTLDDGKYGKIVPPADQEAFRKGLKEILEDKNAAELSAKAGKQFLLKYMDAERVARAHISLYQSLHG